MNNKRDLKELILLHLFEITQNKIEVFSQAIDSAKESRNNDTKSSAGDKYETGREMMQIEIDKNTVQLQNSKNLKEELSRISTQKIYTKAEFGSLITTNRGVYFLAIGIGKIMVHNNPIFVISNASPIGKLIENKKIGDAFQFQSIEYIIQEIA